jgi:pimeloyl-ACP methyl ester carboxylesterase
MFRRTLITICLLLASPGAKETNPHEYAIHLPGIAGSQRLDRNFVQGLRDGGYAGTIDIYDWPGADPGLGALFARPRNEAQAEKLAAIIQQIYKKDPDAKVRIVCHSGGAGIAAWALERLPDDVKVDTLVMIAPALSQRYDLSKALARVRHKAYALTSVNDVLVLGAGTRMFGTIDGIKEEASGLRGFTMPEGADAEQYEKLVQVPYDESWMDLGNIGDHIGPMGRRFAAEMISPLLQGRDMPAAKPRATTKPTRQRPAERARGPDQSKGLEPAAK